MNVVKAPVVLKFGGELLEDSARMNGVVASVAAIVKTGTPLTIVHGGGKEIDAALKVAGIEKRQVEGLRITDEPTLEVVVSVIDNLLKGASGQAVQNMNVMIGEAETSGLL